MTRKEARYAAAAAAAEEAVEWDCADRTMEVARRRKAGSQFELVPVIVGRYPWPWPWPARVKSTSLNELEEGMI